MVVNFEVLLSGFLIVVLLYVLFFVIFSELNFENLGVISTEDGMVFTFSNLSVLLRRSEACSP